MSVDARSSPNRDVLATAKERVRIGPAPEWVLPCSYAIDFKTKTPAPVTHLLIDRQVHAELRQTFERMAVRLETMQAVQHHSQWRLEFSPQTQAVDLHSIKIRRGDVETEHAALDRVHFLQREAGLEGFVIDGWVTLLLLLEDVRSGDVLEWSYTVHGGPQLLPDSCAALFSIPENIQLGKHHLSVRFAEGRALKWKSSAADLAPTEERGNGEVRWLWLRENYTCPEREEGTPGWYVAHPWIQVSDCPDWQTVAAAFSKAWKEETSADTLAAQVQEIMAVEPDVLRRADRAIQLVQDGFRYLSVNLELGGHVPTDSETVIRRRYGDCKDLAFLLVQVLRRLGISARPVLVNTVLQKSIRDMLPSTGLFNHAVVEYQVDHEKRWVDPTIKGQGGGALNRIIPNYGLGLPVDEASPGLVPPPAASLQTGVYELKEAFLVDTTGDWSYLAVTVKATGIYAENLRLEFENDSLDVIAKRRLQACIDKFSQARRIGSLEYRDDREANQFLLAEVFEINGFLITDEVPNCCWLQIQNSALIGTLPVPPATRRMPLALPYPCKVVHVVEIESLGLSVAVFPASKVRNEFFELGCTSRGIRKFMSATFTLTTLTDAVMPARLGEYQKQVERAMPLSAVQLPLPLGYPRLRKRKDFGALPLVVVEGPPLSPEPDIPLVPSHSVPPRPGAMTSPLPASSLPEETIRARQAVEGTVPLDPVPRRGSQRRSRRRRDSASGEWKKSEFFWIAVTAAALAVVVGLVFLITRFAQH